MDGSDKRNGRHGSILWQSETLLSIGLLGVLVVLLVPLPSFLLDMLLATNLSIAILLLLVTLGVTEPLEVSVFPSLLLLLTLGRLSLNVATTRLILLHGDAGRIVSAFGGYVVGGNLIVGLVIFLILVVIQFIVITKGSSRISEVAARFTLDALPGKQMAIDAELGAGSIDEAQARARREQLARETEFHGAMDGAGKFVRGDAIAGLVITGINLVGGVVLGMTNGMGIAEAVRRYSILTVGDGLVSQIPALIIAITAGILVTKATSRTSLGDEIGGQLLKKGGPLVIGGTIVFALAIMPGLPKIPFLLLSGVLFAAWRSQQAKEAEPTPVKNDRAAEPKRTSPEDHLEQFLQHDRACVEVGVRLIPLVESKRTKGIAERITNLRSEMGRKHGIWIPAIRIRDNIHLGADSYRIMINGREIARSELHVDDLLAIDPGGAKGSLEGISTQDPAFGLPAKWIGNNLRQRAELNGFTVVDAATVLITHLGEILRRYAHEMLSREDLRKLLEKVRETSPSVVDELKPDLIRMGDLHQVIVLLLEERVPISNMTRILETIAHHASKTKNAADLADAVRHQLGRDILDRFRDPTGSVTAIVLDPRLEQRLREFFHEGVLSLPPEPLERLVSKLNEQWQKNSIEGRDVALLADGTLRRPLRQMIVRALPDLGVVAYHEIPNDTLVDFKEMLKLEDVFAAQRAGRLEAEATAAKSPGPAVKQTAAPSVRVAA